MNHDGRDLSRALISRRRKVMLPSTIDEDSRIVIDGANGCFINDVNGKSYLDFTSQVGMANVGHCHPKVVEAVQRQAGKLMTCIGSDFDHELQVQLCEELIKITPGDFPKKAWLDVGGAEGIIAAVEYLLHTRPERQVFIAFRGGFHGRKGYAKDLSCSKAVQKKGYRPSLKVFHFPYMDIKAIQDCFGRDFDPEDVNAVVLEFIQGEGGINPAPPQKVKELVKLCEAYDIKIVDDEIQTGLGRTGKMWACEHYHVAPDILVTSKSLGSGLPISATVVPQVEFAEKKLLPLGWHSLTFMGSPICCAAALATLKVIQDENLASNAWGMGNYFRENLYTILKGWGTADRRGFLKGVGLMTGIEFQKASFISEPDTERRDKFISLAFDEGLLLIGCGHPNINPTVRFLPPLCIDKSTMDLALGTIKRAFDSLK